jgi:hypothetical protein
VLNVLVLLVGCVAGFVGSRKLRRPDRAAQAASVARNVGGTLGRRKGLTAPELQRACFSEMVRHVRVTRQGRTHAPAKYLLHLHPDDLAVVEDSRRWFTDGLADALRQAAADNGWLLDGTVEIDYRGDPARRPGVPSALAVAPDGSAGDAPVAPPPAPGRKAAAGRGLVLVRDDTGERVPLGGEPVTIGRSRDRTITIDDTRVSRAHAHIERRQGDWALTDDGSANGTRVGGRDLAAGQPRPLRAGDVIGIGPVELRVTEAPAPTAPEPGTRALEDSDRTRISGQVLPPPRRPRP